jgi:peroxiredoxin Q/BCP
MTRLALLAPCLVSLSLLAACKQEPAPAQPSAAAPNAAVATAPTEAKAQAATAPIEAKPQAELAEGDVAPDIALPLQNGKTVKLSDFKGKPVAIYFYPADATPGCTVEAQGIRDTWADLSKEGVVVIGVSAQDADSHKAFIEKEKLPYDLAIDANGTIAKAFGVPSTMGYHSRQTVLVGKDGKVKKIWRKVSPQGHAQEILSAAKS